MARKALDNNKTIPVVGLSNDTGNEVNPATEEQIGEVQATPAQYTVLRRLKEVEDKLDVLEITNNAIQAAVELVRQVDSGNSTVANLGNGGVFTGDWFDALGFSSIVVKIFTNQGSAVDGFEFQTGTDGTNATHIHKFSVDNNTPNGTHYVFTLTDRYYRIVYTNGTTPQTSFNLSSVLSKNDATHSHTHPVEFVINGNHEAQLNRTVLVAKRADNAYSNIRSTNGNNLKISLEEIEDGISSNSNSQLNVTQFDSSGLETNRIADTPEFYEDTSFVTGDSPATLDLNDDLGRNAITGTIINDGPGDFTVSFSTNGTDFGDEITMATQEQIDFDKISVDKIRITWVADSAYRVVAI